MELEINKIFDEKYKIIDVLGEGGMGKVYHVQNTNLGNYWAIKQVSKQTNGSIDLLAEPNIMKKLNHPSLPRIFDILEDHDYIYIVLDYVEGISLDKLLLSGRRFSEQQVIEWAKQICDVYNYLHKLKPHPIIYRDMKPSNLMVTPNNEIKVIDFGIAREYKVDSRSDTMYLGTEEYAAPEQKGGTAQTDERSDIYSLGVTLFHTITGKRPYEEPYGVLPIRSLDPSLSEGLEYIIEKCTQLEPDQRYQNAASLLHDLKNIDKLSKSYKKQRLAKRIRMSGLVASLTFFSYLTLAGIDQLREEKVLAYDNLVSEATANIDRSQFPQAKEKLEKAMDLIPDNISAYQQVARSLILEGKYEEAINYITNEVFKNVADSELDSEMYYLIGTAAFEMKDYEEAIQGFEKAVKLSNGNSKYYRDLAISYARAGDFQKANESLSKLEKLDSDKALNLYVTGEIQIAQSNYNDALNSFKEALGASDDETIKYKSFIALANLYKHFQKELNDDNVNQRIAVLEKASHELKNKNDVIITELLAEAYHDKAVYEGNNRDLFVKSIEKFQFLLDRGYQRPYIYLNIAIIYQLMQEYSESEKVLLKMIELYPNNYTGYVQLALLYIEIENQKPVDDRNYDKVVKYYELATKNSPDGTNTPEIVRLHKLIVELREKGWIK
ncbi:protein kinase domain-containing protein [Bacillus sp. OTU530]|uniref:protein kinase domain-containing protein n=1 Tax=Bacillus sp. OTU530 TaxID=3043862 RepID=UPI00313E0588